MLLLWSDRDVSGLDELAAAARERAHGRLRTFVVLPAIAPETRLATPVVRDGDGAFAVAYGAVGRCAFVIRPDGYLGYRQASVDAEGLFGHLGLTFV